MAALPLGPDSMEILTSKFSVHNLDTTDLVALSGKLYIPVLNLRLRPKILVIFGRVQCGVITNRLHNFTGNNGQSDPSIEPKFLRTLRRKCLQGRSLTARVNLDPTSPDSFDNDYFKNLCSDTEPGACVA